MQVKNLKEYFGTYRKAMDAGGYSRSVYLHWKKSGNFPYQHQKRFEYITNGKLKADESLLNNIEYGKGRGDD